MMRFKVTFEYKDGDEPRKVAKQEVLAEDYRDAIAQAFEKEGFDQTKTMLGRLEVDPLD